MVFFSFSHMFIFFFGSYVDVLGYMFSAYDFIIWNLGGKGLKEQFNKASCERP
jgi:hypothetical protein